MKITGKNDKRREKTRQNMLLAASKGFRSHGFEGIGVDTIAKGAGATSGAFYAHLGSKKNAFLYALELGLQEVVQSVPKFQNEHDELWLEAFADYYLGSTHRKDLACGCAMASLSPDIARQTKEAQTLYAQYMEKIAALVAKGLTGNNQDEKLSRAWSFLSILIGGLTVTRALGDNPTAETIASNIKQKALEVAG
ncbi:TetR/AcrR family transcriptional regulator [Puniceicoccaceae bacterium K14]|nr:TetR/AcrR family transcriptional regulator [Puniceicoccaceae bacterium K14]